MNQFLEDPIFFRFISAKQLMERWGMDYIQLRQLNELNAFWQTAPVDYKNFSGNMEHLKKVTPFTKKDFETVVYDTYDIQLYEYRHPEIVKNMDIVPQLKEAFFRNNPEFLKDKKPTELKTDSPTETIDDLVKKAIAFCKKVKDAKGQFPTRAEVQSFLENHLDSKKIQIGKHSTLPDLKFRKIYRAVPIDCKRRRGVTSKS